MFSCTLGLRTECHITQRTDAMLLCTSLCLLPSNLWNECLFLVNSFAVFFTKGQIRVLIALKQGDIEHFVPLSLLVFCRGSQWKCARRPTAAASDPQRADQQPDRQAEVLLHLQNIPAATGISLQHLRQLRRWVELPLAQPQQEKLALHSGLLHSRGNSRLLVCLHSSLKNVFVGKTDTHKTHVTER